jgi:parvulin-like peptidyl-prolyl isomerase
VSIAAVSVLFAAACGGSSSGSTAAADDPAAAQAAAEAATAAEVSQGSLQSADEYHAVEVLDVADGSVTTLAGAITGDRPVLVWFYAPH